MVDTSKLSRVVSLKPWIFLTPEVMKILSDGGKISGEDLQKRISLMLDNILVALTQRKGPVEDVLRFSMPLGDRGSKPKKLILKAEIVNHESEPASITVMLPDEEIKGVTEKRKGKN